MLRLDFVVKCRGVPGIDSEVQVSHTDGSVDGKVSLFGKSLLEVYYANC